jgi:hypothetical protein
MTTVLEKNELQRAMLEKYLKPDTEYVSHHGYDIESVNLEGLTDTVCDLLKRKAFKVSHSVNTVRKVDAKGVLDKATTDDLSVEMVGDLEELIYLFFNEGGPIERAGISVQAEGFYIVIHQNEDSPKAFVDMLNRVYHDAHQVIWKTDTEDRDD